jgi:hypothetical protein
MIPVTATLSIAPVYEGDVKNLCKVYSGAAQALTIVADQQEAH